MGLYVSLFVFVPILVLAIIFAKPIVDYPVYFGVGGSGVVSIVGYLAAGVEGIVITGVSAACASIAFLAMRMLRFSTILRLSV